MAAAQLLTELFLLFLALFVLLFVWGPCSCLVSFTPLTRTAAIFVFYCLSYIFSTWAPISTLTSEHGPEGLSHLSNKGNNHRTFILGEKHCFLWGEGWWAGSCAVWASLN